MSLRILVSLFVQFMVILHTVNISAVRHFHYQSSLMGGFSLEATVENALKAL